MGDFWSVFSTGYQPVRGQPFWEEIRQSLRKCPWWTEGPSDVTLELEGCGGIPEVHGGV